MRDEDCIRFLQWALPQLHMRWPGFRKVRAQVCKRLARRVKELGYETLGDYRGHLETTSDEWPLLDGMCRISVSRFYRDKMLFAFLERRVLPVLARQAVARGDSVLKVWCAGAGSGEEPYSIDVLWKLQLQSAFPDLHLHILASDIDPVLQRRARLACYPYSAVKNLPVAWRERVFARQEDLFCLRPDYRSDVHFIEQDVRSEMPDESFDLLLCRNLVFTYFVEQRQREILARLRAVIRLGGALVTGIHENLPADCTGFDVWSEKLRVFRKRG